MADQETANQAPARASDELVAAGVLVPFEEMEWTDFPLETRLRALRFILDVIRRRRAEIAAELKAA
jgi:acyl-CoA reductase-like NAD-dependent aldehyde dehydrogenase